jgi:cytochrome c peroxidase
MIAVILLFFNSGAFALDRTSQLPIPWNQKQALFDKLDPKMIDTGERLFNDPLLSRNKRVSCASCHQAHFAFSNGLENAKGLSGIKTEYNVPVLFNRIESKLQFWDGRTHSLTEQVLQPIANAKEMDLSVDKALARLNASPYYRKAFGGPVTRELLETALVSFISSLASGGSRFDRFEAGASTALSAGEQEGKKLFFEKFKCVRCHSGPGFTNESLSLRCGSTDASYATLYKVPTLRNLASSQPYLHNGHLEKLRDVLEFYDQKNNPNGISISKDEKEKLLEFLGTLNAPIVSYRPARAPK